VSLGAEPLAEPLEPSAYRAFRLCDECRTQTASVYATSLPLSCSFALRSAGTALMLSVLVCWACFMYARIWCTNRPETIVENSRTKNDLGAKGGGGLRRRGQASGGRHTHGGQCGKMGPPQRVWGNSGGDSRRCDTQGRPSAEEANARSAGGRASASTSAEEANARSAGSSIDMYNNDVGQESAQKFMKQTGDLKAATLYFAS